jgi:UDP-2,3-diacylglucosamine pyrophosphatase LpxH
MLEHPHDPHAFASAQHTIVLSDVHLTEAEPPDGHPKWKAYKRREHFVDQAFARFLEKMHLELPGQTIELVLNGDIFDFDSVLTLPLAGTNAGSMTWLERQRGLHSEEPKSLFKLTVILQEHPEFIEALSAFVKRGHRVVFVIGNHDLELHWPTVQQALLQAIAGPDLTLREHVRLCDWFYLSNGDTLIEHGNQYDEYCLTPDPLTPFVSDGDAVRVRVPFGNLAERYMLNGMGLMNPHVEATFIKPDLGAYLVFFARDVLRVQPLLLWTWLWGACVTFVQSLREGWLPFHRSAPANYTQQVRRIADRSNVDVDQVWAMREQRAHSAVFRPWSIAQELWLDRLALILGVIAFCTLSYLVAHRVAEVPAWWVIWPAFISAPMALLGLSGNRSRVAQAASQGREDAAASARLLNVRRVIHGHTHDELHAFVRGVEYLNTGTWSPAFRDPECTQRYGSMCFAWVRPGPPQASNCAPVRVSSLFVFDGERWSERDAPAFADLPSPTCMPAAPHRAAPGLL